MVWLGYWCRFYVGWWWVTGFVLVAKGEGHRCDRVGGVSLCSGLGIGIGFGGGAGFWGGCWLWSYGSDGSGRVGVGKGLGFWDGGFVCACVGWDRVE